MGFTMFARCFLDIMYLVLLLFNDNFLILSHSLILDIIIIILSLLISDVMFLVVSSLNESIVVESVVSSAYIMK